MARPGRPYPGSKWRVPPDKQPVIAAQVELAQRLNIWTGKIYAVFGKMSLQDLRDELTNYDLSSPSSSAEKAKDIGIIISTSALA